MNIGIIISPNEKGQIVIPQKIREELGITSKTYLQLTQSGNSIVIAPIKNVVTTIETDTSYAEILKKTAGSWAGDDWPETRVRRRRIELTATKKHKQAW